jgi:hypothetical protein
VLACPQVVRRPIAGPCGCSGRDALGILQLLLPQILARLCQVFLQFPFFEPQYLVLFLELLQLSRISLDDRGWWLR